MLPLSAETASKEPTPQAFSEAEIAELAGVYSNHRQKLELLARDSRLHLRRGSTGATPVIKLGPNRLGAHSANEESGNASGALYIVRGPDGSPEYLYSGSRAFKRQPAASASSN
jgi:hypothetical protein